MELPSLQLSPRTTLFSLWSRFILGNQMIASQNPLTFGAIAQDAGFVLYETMLPDSMNSPGSLHISKLYDRATIYVNNVSERRLSFHKSANTF